MVKDRGVKSRRLKKIELVQTLEAAEGKLERQLNADRKSVLGKLIANDRLAVYHPLRIIL